MPYHVSRNGQMYGPYTLEDLQRYVASGNVLLTDLAKSEEMPEWLPVAQILGAPSGTPSPDLPIPPSAPAYPQAAGAAYPDPPNLNWGLELLLGFFTCGLFVVVWNLVIAAWAKRVQPASNALMYYIIATVLVVLNFGGSFGVFFTAMLHQHPHQSVFGTLIRIASWVVRLIARFTLRDTLEQHFNAPAPPVLRLTVAL